MRGKRSHNLPKRKIKPSVKENNTPCCNGCKSESRPWRYVEDYVRDKWNEMDFDIKKGKPCICFNGAGAPSSYDEIETIFLKKKIQTTISVCGEKMKITFISNGEDARRFLLKQEKEQEEKARERELEEERQKIPNFRSHLISLRENKKFPFNYLSDLSQHDVERLEVIEGDTPPGGIFQLYILRLKDGGIYVGETELGYPWRIYNHIRGHNAAKCTKNNLTYGQDEWDKNLIQELMEIVQPIGKKYPCTHVFEWWLQQEMLKREIWLSCGIAEAGKLPWGKTCETCNDIAKENNIQWES